MEKYNPRRLGFKVDPDKVRRHIIRVFFTDSESDYLNALAEQCCMTPASFIRHSIFIEEPPTIVNVPEVNREAWSFLSKLAANLNRCVQFVHSGQLSDGGEMLPILKEIKSAISDLKAALVGEPE